MKDRGKPKQVIVLRTRYPDGKGGFFKPRTGKLIAQGAHAAMKVFFDLAETGFTWRVGSGGALEFNTEDDPRNTGDPAMLVSGLTPEMVDWVEGLFTKIVVGTSSGEELLDVYEKAKIAKIPCALITDAGDTEFHGVTTNTAVAIGPDYPDRIDPITGHMKLL